MSVGWFGPIIPRWVIEQDIEFMSLENKYSKKPEKQGGD